MSGVGVREVKAAEMAACAVFGVGVSVARTGKGGESARLAQGAAVTVARSLHEERAMSWNDSADAFDACEWPLGVSGLRASRRRFAQLMDARGEFARALRGLLDRVLGDARLLLLSPGLAA